MEIESKLKQAEYILDALGWCSDDEQYELLITMAKEILKPYWEKSHPRALWLKAGMPNLGEESSSLSASQFDEKYTEILRIAAECGCAEAQYQHGCNLYDVGRIAEAVKFYFKAAQKDYAPAQWCYGLDVLHGNGTDKDESIGLAYIRLSAEQRYEYAVKFMIDAHENGKYGFNDETELQKWQRVLPHCEYRY